MFPPVPQTFLDAFWRGQQRRLALALHEGFLLFWESDSAEFQCEQQEWVFAVEYQLCFGGENQITPQFLSGELEWALANNRVGRRFQLADTLTVFLRAYTSTRNEEEYLQQRSFVVFRLGEVEKSAYFGPENGVLERSLSEWARQLHVEEFNRSYADGGFADALSGANIPLSSKGAAKMCLSQETEAQMQHIADLIFRLSPEWVQEALSEPKCEGGIGMVVFLPLGKAAHFVCGAWTKFGFCPVPHPCVSLWDIWLNYFAPSPDTLFHAKDIEKGCRLFYRSFAADLDCDIYDWERSRPHELSQHEQMELKLELHDWLRERVGLSDQRIAELLA